MKIVGKNTLVLGKGAAKKEVPPGEVVDVKKDLGEELIKAGVAVEPGSLAPPPKGCADLLEEAKARIAELESTDLQKELDAANVRIAELEAVVEAADAGGGK